MDTYKQVLWMFLIMGSLVFPVQATDGAKEQRWANQVAEFLVDGESHWLDAHGEKFLGIYTGVTDTQTKGAVILLHSRGVHPDWPQVIRPLRSQLPDNGWATLSLQMPVLDKDASKEAYVPLFKEVPVRIEAALDFLSARGINNIVLLGHGLGTNMATDYLARHTDPRIKGFVGIGMEGNQKPTETLVLDNVAAMLQMRVPVLDVYGSQTSAEILASVDRRAFAVYQTGQPHSRQIKINDANRFFQGHESELLISITDWMTGLANQKTANKLYSAEK